MLLNEMQILFGSLLPFEGPGDVDVLLCCAMQDGEVRKQFERSLKKQGFAFKLNTKVGPGVRAKIYALDCT